MWHSSLRGCLPAPLPANCFHAGVQSNRLARLGRDPTCLPANAFLSFNIQGKLSVHKSPRLPGLLAEAIHHHGWDISPLGSRSSRAARYAAGGRRGTTQPYTRLLLGKFVLYTCKIFGRSVVMQGPGKSHRWMLVDSPVSTQVINA